MFERRKPDQQLRSVICLGEVWGEGKRGGEVGNPAGSVVGGLVGLALSGGVFVDACVDAAL